MSDKLVAVTSANAEGVAVADFDMARFSATTSAVGSTGKEAKDSLKKTVDKMVSLYDSLKAEGVAENLRTNVSVQPKHEYNRNGEPKLVGYEAKYSMVFHTPDLDKVSKIHDSLTNINGVQANEPTFDVKNKSSLSKEAFKVAFDKCQDRFASECAVLGKDPNDFEVGSWNVHYSEDDRRGVGIRTMSANVAYEAAESPIEIHAGKAEVTCRLSVSYVPKKKV